MINSKTVNIIHLLAVACAFILFVVFVVKIIFLVFEVPEVELVEGVLPVTNVECAQGTDAGVLCRVEARVPEGTRFGGKHYIRMLAPGEELPQEGEG